MCAGRPPDVQSFSIAELVHGACRNANRRDCPSTDQRSGSNHNGQQRRFFANDPSSSVRASQRDGVPIQIAFTARLAIDAERHLNLISFVYLFTSLSATERGDWLPVSPPAHSLNASVPALLPPRSPPSFPV